jgi:hypothetical protein
VGGGAGHRVVSQRVRPAIDSAYAPDFLATGTTPSRPDDTAQIGAQALDRILGDDSEWRGVVEDSGSFAEAVADLQPTCAAMATIRLTS